MEYKLPGNPSSSFIFCSVSRSIWPRIEVEEMAVIYFITFIMPWVRNMQGILSPKLFGVPCLIGVGILLQNPEACRPTFNIGVVIFFQSLRVKERAGAGYLRVLRIVEWIERRAFCGDIW